MTVPKELNTKKVKVVVETCPAEPQPPPSPAVDESRGPSCTGQMWLAGVLLILLPNVGSLLTSSLLVTDRAVAMDWYNSLYLPKATPPGGVIGIAWFVLYTLMGVASFLVYRSAQVEEKKKEVSAALQNYFLHLFFNWSWYPLFFGLHEIFGSMVLLWFTFLYVCILCVSFWQINTIAGILFIPYVCWLAFAGYLNTDIYILNKAIAPICSPLNVLVACLLLPQLGSSAASFFVSRDSRKWFNNLSKPGYCLSNWLLGVIPSCLYALLGAGCYLVWMHGDNAQPLTNNAYILYFTLLLINWSFIPVCLGTRSLFTLLLLEVASTFISVATIILFYNIHATAGYLLVPYLVWLVYCCVTTSVMWFKNRPTPPARDDSENISGY